MAGTITSRMDGLDGHVPRVRGMRRTSTKMGRRNGEMFEERFTRFLTNDWVHLTSKVAALEAKVHLVLGMLSVLVGLIVYLVVQND